MINAIINLGLFSQRDRGEGNIGAPIMYFETHGMRVQRVSLVRAGAEPTLVLHLTHPSMPVHLFERLVFSAAEMRDQDCIAVSYADEGLPAHLRACTGKLIGPKSAEWGEFDPAKFEL